MPTTIEVLRDVTVGRGPHERTRLTVFGADSDEFVIRYTGSEHFLLGLLRGEGTVAGSILRSNGLRLHAVRQEILTLRDAR